MGTRQIALKSRSLKVRAGHGSAAAAAVPGLAAVPAASSAAGPEPAAEPEPATGPPPAAGPEAADRPEPTTGPEPAAGSAAAGSAAKASLPVEPQPEPQLQPEPQPGAVVPARVPTGPVIPAKPTRPPTVPAPSLPDGAPGPSFQPLFPTAPGLNWAGPGDSWSQAWALETLAETPVQPVAPVVEPAAEQAPTAEDVALIRATLAVVEPVADRATAHFYALIFVHHPEVRALFPAAMDVQRDRLFRALLMAAASADDPAGLREYLGHLGRGHRKYGTLTGHYGPVGECLVAALARYGGSGWDERTELAWRRVYGLVSRIMIEAAEEAALATPPWWQAEVVAHRQATPEVAVLTLRPDQAYPFRAGQYTAVETPWWPRVWRHFSFAAAPRPDGLLTLHVKAVQAGWVSNALVHRARPGDVLRLGPAAGGMVLDHAAGRNLLCLGGGTGIAPIAALVEEVAEHGADGRKVEVFYGARRAEELYQLAGLRELAARHPWLTVRPVVSEQSVAPGEALAGELPEVVARYAPWHGFEAYLSGPPAMVRRGVAALRRSGVAAGSVHHDLVGDLA
ncbi:globin domain-containing protein [Kitasatospora sp. NPDC049285]|uniref:globin domain-containing protein n=1 Tax=Kitasatospora sp. NPDC049285 TaxID=3157096 RepID=UPI003413AD3E